MKEEDHGLYDGPVEEPKTDCLPDASRVGLLFVGFFTDRLDRRANEIGFAHPSRSCSVAVRFSYHPCAYRRKSTLLHLAVRSLERWKRFTWIPA